VRHGGKVDPDALLKRIAAAPTATEEEGSAAELLSEGADDRVVAAPGTDDDAPNRVVFVLQRDLQKRLDKYLTDRIPFMSRTQLQRLIDEGGVNVNSRPPKASTKLRINDRVEVFIPPPPPSEVQPEDIPLDVLYEDEHIIVLNKQPDIIVHPARSHNKGTLINALAYHFAHRSPAGGALSTVGKEFARPGVVHRLDRNTSGLIVFAKDDTSHWRLARQFETRTVDKRYLAIVHGLVEPVVEVIDKPIGPHPSKEKGYREKYVVRHDVLGKPSVTICRVRAHFSRPGPRSLETTWSLVELELKTGRTHQIRVHLSHGGYPIVGDDMYGGRPLLASELGAGGAGSAETAPAPLINRQALHAATLSFRHPISHQPMSFQAPLPADMRSGLLALAATDPAAPRQDPPGATVDLTGLLPG
jgi:23S rRNA pseudouridine1911/1915/1917 synthase